VILLSRKEKRKKSEKSLLFIILGGILSLDSLRITFYNYLPPYAQ